MDCPNPIQTSDSPYELLLKAAFLIPIYHYLLVLILVVLIFVYNFLEIHMFQDLFTGFRGQSVSLTFNSSSAIYQEVASKCKILHGRYLATPWLSSPHLQTAFLSLYAKSPVFSYKRQLFHTSDGGTIALDWLIGSKVGVEADFEVNAGVNNDDNTPIMIVVPGLTSDSASAYVKHLAFQIAKRGWNVVVSNHRGLGGISMTSDCFYNAGWTEDIRAVIDHLRCHYPEAPLFAVGTSIGANVLVKYLGEYGVDCCIAGAAAICSPWDLLLESLSFSLLSPPPSLSLLSRPGQICDRFINRRRVQKFYDKALTIGLKGYAQLHEEILSRVADWEGITKSCSVREFDNYATRVVGKYETVDTYYRRCSSAGFVKNVMVPLLCISAMDDPVCTREAIPWDECRANNNIVLAVTQHGGHLAYFEGITAQSIWWVKAVDEFLSVLHSSPLMHRKMEMRHTVCLTYCKLLACYLVAQKGDSSLIRTLESSVDQGPYVSVMEDGLVTAVGNETPVDAEVIRNQPACQNDNDEDAITDTQVVDHMNGGKAHLTNDLAHSREEIKNIRDPIRKCMDQLSRQSKKSIWLLAYIAIVTTWPLVGSALLLFFKKKLRSIQMSRRS
ncbi:hypothetical protein RJ640_025588 [Escallonia rubra]|uniref:Serine aminopeptidase S33 domain-containing protein n=1 Tax=Escallonia rubra TaxID=112253 RepID=A0AA88U8S2_9ASTE|nr:hypothetical protein RJ640_025588 [Escallonia rubra]